MFTYLQINIFSLLILVLIYINTHKNPEKHCFDYKIFFGLIISTALLLIFDCFMVLIDGQAGEYARILNIVITEVYYVLNPLPCLLWTLYALFLISKDEAKIKRMLLPLFIPVIINALGTIISLFVNFLFYIDKQNIYHRGNYFYILVIICYGYLIYSLISIIINKKRISRQNFLPMLMFALPPTIGGIVQTLYYGVATLWTSVTFSILFIYTNIQNLQLHTDYLTGLFNRRQFDSHLKTMINRRTGGKLLAGIMIDLNDFKKINDIFGHSTGDIALEETGKLLKKSLRKDDFISRYGGDEFAVILEVKDMENLETIKNKLLTAVEDFNVKKTYPFHLSFSIGYDIYDDLLQQNMEDFLKNIDDKMYEDKNQVKK